MRSRTAIFGPVFAALALFGATTAGAAGPRDYAVGSAKNTFPTGGANHLMVSAHGFGADVTGHVRATGDFLGEFKLEGEVTCLRVEGNRAAIKYRFKHAEGSLAAFEGGGVQVFVEDNGNPGDDNPPDRNSTDFPQSQGVFDAGAAFCDDPSLRPDPAFDPIDSGNYTVYDAG